MAPYGQQDDALAVVPAPPAQRINVRPVRRQSTAHRFETQPDAEKTTALTFRALPRPRTRFALPATIVVCTLLQLIVGAPYAANERMADDNSALLKAIRGLVVGNGVYCYIGPQYHVPVPILVSGGFRPRYFFSWPITLGVGVGLAFIPVDGSTFGMVSIMLLTFGLSYILCTLLLNAAFFQTDEHRALAPSFGPPVVAIFLLFYALNAAYVALAQRYSSPLVGLLLPAGSAITRALLLVVLVRSFDKFYYKPKASFLAQLPPSSQSQDSVPPPLFGDIEGPYGYTTAAFALIIKNAGSVATIVGAMLAIDSSAWVLSLAVSAVLELLNRTGIQQRVELWIAARLGSKFGLQWPVRMAQISAMDLLYFRSLGGTGYFAPIMALSIGCLRAITFGDPASIIWLDASPMVWQVLLAQLVFQVLVDVAVWAVEKRGLCHFELSDQLGPGHPLRNTAFRDFDLKGYVFAFGMGGFFLYSVFAAFLGPAFVTGICHNFTSNATHIWVARAPASAC